MRPLLDLLLPAACVGCRRPGGVACQACLRLLQAAPVLRWPDPAPVGLPPPVAVADYDGAVRAMLLAYKERGTIELRKPLAAAVALSVQAIVSARVVTDALLVPIPSMAAARRTRGADVVMDLARVAARCLRASGARASVVSALRHRRAVADSAGLTSEQRAANLVGALVVRPVAADLLSGRSVILVDDLVTTGATLAEAARALRVIGALPVASATVAATRRRPGVRPGRPRPSELVASGGESSQTHGPSGSARAD